MAKIETGCIQMELLKNFHKAHQVEIGVDEAGRGALYGRVYSAAVIWPETFTHPLIRDSKTLSPFKREQAYQIVQDHAIAYGIAYCEAAEIDQINIRRANFRAMHKAIDQCGYLPDLILVDGCDFIPYLDRKFEPVETLTVVKGDQKYLSIAAASILAKVSRDRYIQEECTRLPILKEYYKIDKNMGYGSLDHRLGLMKYNCQPEHRKVGFTEKYVENVE